MVDPSDYSGGNSGSDDRSLPSSDIEPNNPRSVGGGVSTSWTTKLDFSKPYVIVAEAREGDILVSKSNVVVLDDADDWRRLDDNPNREVRALATWDTRTHWLNFCNLAADQYNEDPNELLEDDIQRLLELDDEVYWPPGSKPSRTRTCQVCGDTSDSDEVSMLELDLHNTRKVPVCASHSVDELAVEGLLD